VELPLPVWLGIEGEEFDGFGMRGVRLQRVIPGGPAAAAGLRGARDPAPRVVRRMNVPWTGYVILAMDGHPVRGWEDLTRLLEHHHPGDRTTLTVTVPPGRLHGDTVVELAAPPRRLPQRLEQ
jgi:S1-C subfamily serine protease